jgi:large subunit ribosomal protein L1
MAKAKDIEEIKEVDETQAEIAEVAIDMPEVELANDAVAAKDKADKGDNVAQPEETELENDADGSEDEDNHPSKLTKAGKHSAKAIREAEEEEARQAAKLEHKGEEDAPRVIKRSIPNPEHAHGKKYRAAAKLVEPGKPYGLDEALDLARKTASTTFDSSVELHINLGVDPRQADQMVRASVVLPHGTGKTVRVAVYADGKAAEDAKAAGADLVGSADLIAQIEKGKLDFDMLVATPAGMATLGKVAKVLGPRGLMPNPKSGTVTPDVAKAVKEAKAGKVEFRIDKQGIVHQAVGKVSFSPENLRENVVTLLSAILKAKPASTKGTYVKALSATTSMGPGIKIDSAATISAISTGKK